MSVPFTPEDKKYTITFRYYLFCISDTYNGSLWHISKQASGVSALATLIKTPVHLIHGVFFREFKIAQKNTYFTFQRDRIQEDHHTYFFQKSFQEYFVKGHIRSRGRKGLLENKT